jgi:hypothetical protein
VASLPTFPLSPIPFLVRQKEFAFYKIMKKKKIRGLVVVSSNGKALDKKLIQLPNFKCENTKYALNSKIKLKSFLADQNPMYHIHTRLIALSC